MPPPSSEREPVRAAETGPDEAPRRYATPTGDPCPRTVRVDGSVVGNGECLCCGFCLLIAEAWGEGLFPPADAQRGSE